MKTDFNGLLVVALTGAKATAKATTKDLNKRGLLRGIGARKEEFEARLAAELEQNIRQLMDQQDSNFSDLVRATKRSLDVTILDFAK